MARDLLTDRECKAAKHRTGPDGRPQPRMLHDGAGLYLRVSPSDTKSWIYRGMVDGRRYDVGLGPYPTFTLAMARHRADALRRAKTDHRDLKTDKLNILDPHHRHVAPPATVETFASVADRYLRAHAKEWTARHLHTWDTSLRTMAYPVIGAMPVDKVDRPAVLKVLRPVWETKTVTASLLRARIESVLSLAISEGLHPGPNPARWADNLEHILAKPSRVHTKVNMEAMAVGEIPALMAGLRQFRSVAKREDKRHREEVAARALQFIILSGCRLGEVVGDRDGKAPLTWGEVDLGERMITIPASRMKGRREHRIPLTDAMLEVMGEPKGPTVPVFDLGRYVELVATVRDAVSPRPVHTHGFRASFSTWANDQGFNSDMVDVALAHKVGNEVSRAYNRSDGLERRRELAEAWSAFCIGDAA